jgi:hypothetical protein
MDEKKRGQQKRSSEGAGDAVQQWEQDSVDVIQDIAHDLLKEVGGVALKEVAVGLAHDAPEQTDAQPMTEAMSVTGARILCDEVNGVGEQECSDRNNASRPEQLAVIHWWQQIEKATSELRVANALGIRRHSKKRKDRGDTDHLEKALRERQRKYQGQLFAPVGAGKKEYAANQVSSVMEEAGQSVSN